MVRMGRILTTLAFGAILASGCGPQESVDEAMTEPTDFAGQMALAKKGNSAAEYNVAVCYVTGNGVARDEREGVKWMAQAGDMKALYYLGDCCYVGFGVPKDREAAIAWYRKSAAQGCKEAKDRMKEIGIK